MNPLAATDHRVRVEGQANVVAGSVRFAPAKALWLSIMAAGAVVGGAATCSPTAVLVWIVTTAVVLLFGHSLGSHRKLIHDSFQCPRWLEYLLVWCGVQVGLAGPLGLLRQHELRDYAQRQPTCHDYLRHGRSFWLDGWWQLCCDLRLDAPPITTIEPRIAEDPFFRFLERTWMLQQVGPALALFACGGWPFVFWGVCARVTAGVVGHWLIGHLAHNRGPMHYTVRGAAVQGRNIRFSALITMGESWHNNHHAFPGSARLGLYPGEWDPGWWVLCALRRVGLVEGLRLPEHLSPRSELEVHDAVASSQPPGEPTDATPFDLRAALRACFSHPNADAARSRFVEGPAAHLSSRALSSIAGTAIPFRRDPRVARLTLHDGRSRLHGLPVLCVLLGARGRPWRALALCLAPIAVAAEALRRLTTTQLHAFG